MKNKFLKYQAKTTPDPIGLEIKKAKGSYIWDKSNKKYLDFIAGISSNPLGHRHPSVIKEIKKQLKKYMHVMVYGEYIQKPAVELCENIVNKLPNKLDVIYLTNSGTEAIEGALKVAKKATGRKEFIAAENSYHGSTHGALSLLGVKKQKIGYEPLLPGVNFIRFNNIDDINLITTKTAAVVLETIQGGAGFILPTNNYLKLVKQKCEDTGALLILDEIQPGFGRTGKLFSFEHFNLVPDILVMGKGMGGGLPIGAFCSSKKIMKLLESKPKLGHITTFGGNPVVAASALATIETIYKENLIDSVDAKEKLFRKRLKHPLIKRINGKGLMLAIIFDKKSTANTLVLNSMDRGLILFWLLWEKKAVRVSPPLNISVKEINKGCDIIISILNKIINP
ncbi:MAG: acetylornithine/N-succinyldiaminopimelate aminotransferase [Candidatus Marivariicella framensis]|jgi:acetylornithine/N-succinyldiaminopimelate aminotransferase|tara:strand:+ start:4040 stop:5224 length:1185 start_codon:yes stop_codon:yes gene_type:complete